MSQESQAPNPTELAQPVKPMVRVVEDSGPVAYLMDTARFEHGWRVARTMALHNLLPKHLIGKTLDETAANCFRVYNQAMRWEMDPYSVCDETYVVNGKLGYQGKLVAAIINARAGLKKRLRGEYSGEGTKRTVTVIGQFASEDKERTVELSVAQAATKNEMWQKDPDQKLWYSGVIKWARRHCPEIILGVLTDDDLERIADSTPAPPLGRHTVQEMRAVQAIPEAPANGTTHDTQPELPTPAAANQTPDEWEKLLAEDQANQRVAERM